MFEEGKITTILDGQFGSTGKGKLAAVVVKEQGGVDFVCNTFSTQAAHWVRVSPTQQFLYRHLNSVAWDKSLFEHMYLGPGCVIDVDTFLREVQEANLNETQVKVHPAALVVTEADAKYEMGHQSFEGHEVPHAGTMLHGSTCSGVGAAAARRVLRVGSLLAKDHPKLKPFLANTTELIVDRLERGHRGLGEISQGYGLSNLHPAFYPHVTYRNVTVAQFFSDMFLPVRYAGPVIFNFRTFPIRINSSKFVATDDGTHLTWDEVCSGTIPYRTVHGNSGGWYPDQKEVSWDYVAMKAGADKDLTELTSKTKLPRRVATFSVQNLHEAVRLNRTNSPFHLALSFADYVDWKMCGASGPEGITKKLDMWITEHFQDLRPRLRYISTGRWNHDMIHLK